MLLSQPKTMDCPHCNSTRFSLLQEKTNLGYGKFRCKVCRRIYNQRTGNPFNFVEVPTDIILEVLFRRINDHLSYREVVIVFTRRGFNFSHETVRVWEEKFLPYFQEQIQRKMQRKIGEITSIDETYLKIAGNWSYLYRGSDKNKYLVDVKLSSDPDLKAVKEFFQSQALDAIGRAQTRKSRKGLMFDPIHKLKFIF